MEKKDVLLFVIVLAIAFFGCQKSKDAEFEKELERITKGYKIEIIQKNDKDDYSVFETLEGIESKSHLPLWKMILFYENEYLNFKNKKIKESLERFARHKYKMRIAHHGAIDSTKVYSNIQILKSKTENSKLSNEEQFFEMVSALNEFPNYFSQAKELIRNPSKEKLEKAIHNYSKDYFYLKNELPLLIRKPDILKEDQINFSQKNEEAQLTVKDFIAYLNSQLFELGE